MSEFRKYPIYQFTVWVKDSVPTSLQEDSLTVSRIFPEELTDEQLLEQLSDFVTAQLERDHWIIRHRDGRADKLESMTVDQAGLQVVAAAASTPIFDSWCLRWFSHETIDAGESDEYFVRSFEDYVHRTQVSNLDESGHRDQPVSLMGAEDRWRWYSFEYPQDYDENPDPGRVGRNREVLPCRCIYCRRRGVVSINH